MRTLHRSIIIMGIVVTSIVTIGIFIEKLDENKYPINTSPNVKMPVHDTNFTVIYSITNGTINGIQKAPNALELIVSEKSTGEGTFIISIPRALVDATSNNGIDDKFFVLINGTDAKYNEIQTTPENRTLLIPLKEGYNKIQIIGSKPL